MGSGRILLTSVVALSAFSFSPQFSAAQDAAIQVPQVENSKYTAMGVINSDNVYLRAGASENYYATSKVDKGAQVTVVGIRFDWLKVMPPADSFSYVAKAYVEKRGDGTVGRVTRPDLNVRAGSSLTPNKTAIQCKLNEGDDVQIIGEADEYFKIKPPTGAYLYINKQFVDLVKTLGPNPDAGSPHDTGTTISETPTGGNTSLASGTATTRPASEVSSAEKDFAKLEEQFTASSTKPLDQQPISEMLTGYQKVVTDAKLPESLKRIADYRIAGLKNRQSAQAALVDAKKTQEEIDKRQQAMKAEKQELEERVKAEQARTYAAIGTLRTSSLQQGAGVLFRLTDPANGRTLVYIRSDDAKLATMIGQFVGVKGEANIDPVVNLNVITPTAVEEMSEAKIPTITAQITPPSLLNKTNQASTETPSDTK